MSFTIKSQLLLGPTALEPCSTAVVMHEVLFRPWAIIAALAGLGGSVASSFLQTPSSTMPAAFDWSLAPGGDFISTPETYLNPPGCESSWAFAAAAMMSARMAIQANGSTPKVSISPQVLINCATPFGSDGCKGGGNLTWALDYIKNHGIVDNTCMGYRAKQQFCLPRHICVSCYPLCTPVKKYNVYHIESYYTVEPISPLSLQAEIYKHGPLACSLVSSSLSSSSPPWKNGINDNEMSTNGLLLEEEEEHISVVVTGWLNSTHALVNPQWGAITFSNEPEGGDSSQAFPLPLGVYPVAISRETIVGCWGVGLHEDASKRITMQIAEGHSSEVNTLDEGEKGEEEEEEEEEEELLERNKTKEARGSDIIHDGDDADGGSNLAAERSGRRRRSNECDCAKPKAQSEYHEVVLSPRPPPRPLHQYSRHFDWRREIASSPPPLHSRNVSSPAAVSMALTPVRSHHVGPTYCGACYAMASTSTFSDRLKIMSGGVHAEDVLMSAQMVMKHG
eukprot:jgi/Bigna1/67498/fgenesh1_pg.3_\